MLRRLYTSSSSTTHVHLDLHVLSRPNPTHPRPPRSSLRLHFQPRHLSASAIRCSAERAEAFGSSNASDGEGLQVAIGSPSVPLRNFRPGQVDNGFLLLSFAAVTVTVTFTALVTAAVPTLFAMGRTAISLAKLADVAREELPSTMTAIRLSGMEISDLTSELSELSQEIADGVSQSAQAMQAAEAGIRQLGVLAHHRTISMIEERANLPEISLRSAIAGAARKTSHVVGQAGITLTNLISGDESDADSDNSQANNHLGS